MEHASKDSIFFSKDVSIGVYLDLAHYNMEAFEKIDSIAKQIAAGIKPPIVADYQNKKSSIFDCFLFYKSKQLDSTVKTLDKESFKSW